MLLAEFSKVNLSYTEFHFNEITMITPYLKTRWYKFLKLVVLMFLLCLLSIIPIKLVIAHYLAPHPQAILTLGGGIDRERFTAQFAQLHPELNIWISTGVPPKQALPIFQAANIPIQQLHLDYRATDTVTNFTALVEDFKRRHIEHLYLITSDFHMPRASAIAFFVLGSQGIAFTPVKIPSERPPESKFRILRDVSRSLVWIATGKTGASFKEWKEIG
jgi:uncharacterized SAM-binding protein YcdF (DUF218 family)